jgi:hypothetical protein
VGEGEGEGENSYRNLDFTPAMEIVKRQRDFKIKESQAQSKFSDNPKTNYLILLSSYSGENSYPNLDFTPATEFF